MLIAIVQLRIIVLYLLELGESALTLQDLTVGLNTSGSNDPSQYSVDPSELPVVDRS